MTTTETESNGSNGKSAKAPPSAATLEARAAARIERALDTLDTAKAQMRVLRFVGSRVSERLEERTRADAETRRQREMDERQQTLPGTSRFPDEEVPW